MNEKPVWREAGPRTVPGGEGWGQILSGAPQAKESRDGLLHKLSKLCKVKLLIFFHTKF